MMQEPMERGCLSESPDEAELNRLTTVEGADEVASIRTDGDKCVDEVKRALNRGKLARLAGERTATPRRQPRERPSGQSTSKAGKRGDPHMSAIPPSRALPSASLPGPGAGVAKSRKKRKQGSKNGGSVLFYSVLDNDGGVHKLTDEYGEGMAREKLTIAFAAGGSARKYGGGK